MDKMRMESPDLTQRNIEAIGALFPNCITETRGADGAIRRAINFDILRQMLTNEAIAGDEAYEFTWVGKKAAMVEASRPIRKTLRPCVEESRDWDTTGNMYIEGDNLDVLKLLQESYLGKVKMIYIDPPYNTGHDFIYKDSFAHSQSEEEAQMGMFDEETGEQLFENTESNGRFHSDWCSMIYPRLMLSRSLLTEDGVIFISIDSGEVGNLIKICDVVFGEQNFIDCITWFKKASPSNDAQFFSNDCEYILVYAKDKAIWRPHRLPLTEKQMQYYQNPDNDPRGPWNSATYTCNKSRSQRPNLYYPIKNPFTGELVYPKETAVWAYSQEQCREHERNNMLFWGVDGKAQFPRFKKFLADHQGVVTRTLWHYDDVNHTQGATTELKNIGLPYFQTPKPTRLIEKMLRIASDKDSVILDFFAGSSTTAHAVMQLNAEDGGHRKYIMVQIPEKTDKTSEAYKAGFSSICEIGKERIRRAGNKIKAEMGLTAQSLDIGFRVLKLDSSNMKPVYYGAGDYSQDLLGGLVSNINEDRTDLDLLFGCLLEWGLPLSLPCVTEKTHDCNIHCYNDGDLIACFAENVPETVIREIASRHPLRAVFRDSSFASSPERINVEEIFKLLSPNTSVKVL